MKRTIAVCSTLVAALVLMGSSAMAGSPIITDMTWSLGAAIPHPHIEAAGAVNHRKFFAISGGTGDCTDLANESPSTDVDIYNPATNTFSAGPSVNIARDEGPIAITVNSSIYLIGGTTICGGPSVTAVEQFSLANGGGWTVLPALSDLPSPLQGVLACGAAVGSKIYEFEPAGIGVFDTTTLNWTVLPANPLLTPSRFCQATRFGKGILITGPGNGSADSNSQRVLFFNPALGTVTLLSQVTVPLAEHTAALIPGQVVVAGGDFALTTVQAITRTQVTTLPTALPVATDDAVGGVIKGLYYIVGGNTEGTNLTPQVLIGTPIFGPSPSN